MRDYVMGAARRGFAVRIHAIGDEAITQAIDIFEEANARFGAPAIGHHCIEHLENMKKNPTSRGLRRRGSWRRFSRRTSRSTQAARARFGR